MVWFCNAWDEYSMNEYSSSIENAIKIFKYLQRTYIFKYIGTDIKSILCMVPIRISKLINSALKKILIDLMYIREVSECVTTEKLG